MPPALYVLGTVWLWSLIPLAVKVAYQSFNFGFISLSRLVVGTIIFALMDVLSGRGLGLRPRAGRSELPGPRRIGHLMWVVIAGVGIGGDLLLYTLGLRYTTASAATLIVSTDGIILALMGVLVLGERGSWLKAGAGVCALVGLVLVGWNGQAPESLMGSKYLLGNSIILGAACCWAVYGLGQRVLARIPGSGLFPIFLVGTAVAGALAVTQPPTHSAVTWPAVGGLLYLGLGGTGLAYVLLARGMARMEAATAGLLGATLPIFTMVEAHLLIGEEITLYLVLGAAMVIVGVALVMRHQKQYGVD